ncbi:MAG: DUF4142 domain-containing protein [Planctomycetota bacterium]|nr:DUF4142 domain-containing protein [Planctomycetota bacterium]
MKFYFGRMLSTVLGLTLFAGGVAVAEVDAPAQPREKLDRSDRLEPGARRPGLSGVRRDQQARPNVEQNLIAATILCNNHEIESAKLAKEHSQNQKVKDFADMMIKEHTQFVQKLQSAAGHTHLGTAARPADRAAPATTGSDVRVTVAKPVVGHIPGSEMLSIKKEVLDQCLEDQRQEAATLDPAKFDKHFIGAQVMAHMQMLAELKVYEKHASPEVAKIFREGQQSTQTHLEYAKNLMKEISHDKSADSDKQ